MSTGKYKISSAKDLLVYADAVRAFESAWQKFKKEKEALALLGLDADELIIEFEGSTSKPKHKEKVRRKKAVGDKEGPVSKFWDDSFNYPVGQLEYDVFWGRKTQIRWVLEREGVPMNTYQIAEKITLNDTSIENTSSFRTKLSTHLAQMVNKEILYKSPQSINRKAAYGMNV